MSPDGHDRVYCSGPREEVKGPRPPARVCAMFLEPREDRTPIEVYVFWVMFEALLWVSFLAVLPAAYVGNLGTPEGYDYPLVVDSCEVRVLVDLPSWLQPSFEKALGVFEESLGVDVSVDAEPGVFDGMSEEDMVRELYRRGYDFGVVARSGSGGAMTWPWVVGGEPVGLIEIQVSWFMEGAYSAVLLHEMGHLAGIPHSPYPWSAMVPLFFGQPMPTRLTARDVAAFPLDCLSTP